MQLSKMTVGMFVMFAVISGIYIFILDGINQYGVVAPTGYNESFTNVLNTQQDLVNTLNTSSNDLNQVDSSTVGGVGNTDFLGFFFNSGYKTAKTAVTGVTGVNTMIDVAIGSLPLDNYGDTLKTLFFAGIAAVLLIGILLNFIIKSGRE